MASDDTKVFENKHNLIPWATYYSGGRPGLHGVGSYQSWIKATGTRHRPRPNCLTTTGFSFNSVQVNTGIYEEFLPDGSGKTGSALFVYGGDPSRNVTESDAGYNSLAKARWKMAGSEFNFGETLAEFDDTLSLIGKTASRLGSAFKGIKSGNFGAASSLFGKSPSKALRNTPISKRVAKGYLEYQFGWQPLIQDVYNAVDAYASTIHQAGFRISKRSGSIPKIMGDAPLQGSPASYSGVVQNATLFELSSLGLLNPALMAWERLPFSFLVDWFFPVSAFIGAITSSAGLTCTSGSRTQLTRSLEYDKKGHVWKTYISGVRFGDSSFPIFRIGRSVSLSVGKLTSSIALLRSLR